ncbi:putative acetylornithine deacetylase protein [Eutypa lata UCREL1]|uniref:Putative acetylornithine deacetylase protein n=1 Tax=Eutypa lata (strain UCR-EL1) TaxID=1287681 RepID=M7T3T1_EUTLA|nr:putative acetylornithine deacetylase protein [Eutypa lata UCREL1]
MTGLDCGTPSSIAWPLVQASIDASCTISDYEAHEASLHLQNAGISAGPCGASGLAALRQLTESDKLKLGLGKDPTLGSVTGPGETAIAKFITSWLEHRSIETHWIEPIHGRPSVIGISRGSGRGKSLMFNGHVDTVTLEGYDGDPLSGVIENGKLYGRGSADMKSGLAAAMVALARAKQLSLRGDVMLAAVADEEDASIGTEQVLRAGWRADAALVSEPTNEDIFNSHQGFVWLEVRVHGIASHGSRPDLGIDAISKAGHFLVELDRYAKTLLSGPEHPEVGHPSVHASIIKGGEETSSYPAKCTITLERRTVPGETPDSVRREVEELLQIVHQKISDFQYDVKVTFHRAPFQLPADHQFTRLVTDIGRLAEPAVALHHILTIMKEV